ncbi:class III extradiol dioxygenase family protein [Magnetospirillum moscoviense]|uniref:Protocatechuate 3,4-dioxygenase n=1 Tax=Magnetospirillum moscoviense TaxID=1437059 RepID=A0A178MXM5_9PROT|nr:class III extradiol dioxygenase family protein [Magnetospirillum moscoviense]MBF0325906.1 protocatechuate 3,4-dioxygenase [Alphaproteobacteria bacterium]OAN58006.1 protocatechuate 3,4-dioxygenase [Magnetospirillum moscoviense]
MAKIVGGICTTHVPYIGRAIAKNLQQDPYWKPFFDGFPPIHAWLDQVKPDVAVVVYNDHGLNFFLDKMPTFSIGAAPEYHHADEGWGIPTTGSFMGDQDLSWHMIDSLIEDEFDLTTCQEMLVDHAFTIPIDLLLPNRQAGSIRTVPVCQNTVQFPLPSAKRCLAFGRAIRKAIESWDSDARVVVLGTGGLSHQLDGERAGFINKKFDLEFMDKLVSEPDWVSQYSIPDIVELTGTQGVELLNWVTCRGVLGDKVKIVHSNYHIPISNTAAGTLAMESI